MKDSKWNYKPAIVRYIGKSDNDFTYGKLYEAFFLEYWQEKEVVSTSVLIVVRSLTTLPIDTFVN